MRRFAACSKPPPPPNPKARGAGSSRTTQRFSGFEFYLFNLNNACFNFPCFLLPVSLFSAPHLPGSDGGGIPTLPKPGACLQTPGLGVSGSRIESASAPASPCAAIAITALTPAFHPTNPPRAQPHFPVPTGRFAIQTRRPTRAQRRNCAGHSQMPVISWAGKCPWPGAPVNYRGPVTPDSTTAHASGFHLQPAPLEPTPPTPAPVPVRAGVCGRRVCAGPAFIGFGTGI